LSGCSLFTKKIVETKVVHVPTAKYIPIPEIVRGLPNFDPEQLDCSTMQYVCVRIIEREEILKSHIRLLENLIRFNNESINND